MEFYHQRVLIFDVHDLFALALPPIFLWSKFSLVPEFRTSGGVFCDAGVEALRTGFSKGCVECFLTPFGRNAFGASLRAYTVSGTNKRGDSP